MACALPNVTSRVLVVGLRLGMAEQHIFQCDVFLYPRTTRGEAVETDGASFGLLASSDLSSERFCRQTSSLASYIGPVMSSGLSLVLF